MFAEVYMYYIVDLYGVGRMGHKWKKNNRLKNRMSWIFNAINRIGNLVVSVWGVVV